MFSQAFDPVFLPLLSAFRLDELNAHGSTVYGIWPDTRLAYANEAWFKFADENGGEPAVSRDWGIGVPIDRSFPEPVRSFYLENLQLALEQLRPWEWSYECSSRDSFRLFRMHVFPLADRAGLLVAHSLIVERPHDPRERPPHDAAAVYLNSAGFVVQCCHCRRVQRAGQPTSWDWVPDWVSKSPTETSHGLCEVCLNYYYRASERHTS